MWGRSRDVAHAEECTACRDGERWIGFDRSPSSDLPQDETTITATTQPQPDIQVPYNLSASFQGTNTVFGLSASGFWSPVGYAFAGSQWQISSTTDFSAPEWDSGIIRPVTSVFVG